MSHAMRTLALGLRRTVFHVRPIMSLYPLTRSFHTTSWRMKEVSPTQNIEIRVPESINKSPIDLIAEIPPLIVQGRVAVCDGGGGPLGHPRVFINLDCEGPRPCGYCGLRFQQHRGHHH
eukprot:TRINITY_DN2766_c0_g1_i1.p1 TRINITY_DN2766_c0_g1~~TRINITY_DN2766_c0_g1_i1.p1  ORF type:complete len:127 (-),score=5.73 TRINITY_DN2766_c0_g1_i1:32-388(-)